MRSFMNWVLLAFVVLLPGCASENCRKYNCEALDYPIVTVNLDGGTYGLDTVSIDSFAVQIFSGKSEGESSSLNSMGVERESDCATCIQKTILTDLTFSVNVVTPAGDTIEADSNYLTEPLKGAAYYKFVFNRKYVFQGDLVRVTYWLLVNDSVPRTGYKDFFILR